MKTKEETNRKERCKTEKPKVGERYQNIHTKDTCIIIDRIFFNILYLDDSGQKGTNTRYCHYETFQKHWIKVKKHQKEKHKMEVKYEKERPLKDKKGTERMLRTLEEHQCMILEDLISETIRNVEVAYLRGTVDGYDMCKREKAKRKKK